MPAPDCHGCDICERCEAEIERLSKYLPIPALEAERLDALETELERARADLRKLAEAVRALPGAKELRRAQDLARASLVSLSTACTSGFVAERCDGCGSDDPCDPDRKGCPDCSDEGNPEGCVCGGVGTCEACLRHDLDEARAEVERLKFWEAHASGDAARLSDVARAATLELTALRSRLDTLPAIHPNGTEGADASVEWWQGFDAGVDAAQKHVRSILKGPNVEPSAGEKSPKQPLEAEPVTKGSAPNLGRGSNCPTCGSGEPIVDVLHSLEGAHPTPRKEVAEDWRCPDPFHIPEPGIHVGEETWTLWACPNCGGDAYVESPKACSCRPQTPREPVEAVPLARALQAERERDEALERLEELRLDAMERDQ